MPTPRVFLYEGCQTCRNAKKWLAAKAIPFQSVDIVATPPAVEELKQALAAGLPLRKLFNTSGQSYREGKWGEKLGQVTEKEALAALAADGKLIKRPFVLGKGFVLVGFREPEWDAAPWPG